MTVFIGIDVRHQHIVKTTAMSLAVAQASFGLVRVDHGVLLRESDGSGLGYVVDEFGLYKPVDAQSYASVFGRVVAGNAVAYAFDQAGETIDAVPNVIELVRRNTIWLPTRGDMERAITLGTIARPTIRINGEVLWSWPDPAPAGMGVVAQ